jgi:hypothetical protein
MRGKTHSSEVSYSGFHAPEGFLGRGAKNKHKLKVTTHTQQTHVATANNIKNTQGNQRTIAEITRGTSSTNDA